MSSPSPFAPLRNILRFCPNCGQAITRDIPPGDSKERAICTRCGAIHYENPKMVVGCLPVWEGRILLCRRAIEPRYGYWTLPAGYMENDESTGQAAARETREEAGAKIELGEPFSMISIPYVNQVHLFCRSSCPLDPYAAENPKIAILLDKDYLRPEQAGAQQTKDAGPKATEQANQGASPKLQPLPDDDQVRPLSREATLAYLRQTEERLKRERQLLLRSVAGPDRPGVRDW